MAEIVQCDKWHTRRGSSTGAPFSVGLMSVNSFVD
jgi:hypothetical protein